MKKLGVLIIIILGTYTGSVHAECLIDEETVQEVNVAQEKICRQQSRTGLTLSLTARSTTVCENKSMPILAPAVKKAGCSCVSGQNNADSVGDLIFMRNGQVMQKFDQLFAKRLTAAHLSQDVQTAQKILETDLSALNSERSLYSGLLITQIAFRLQSDEAGQWLEFTRKAADRRTLELADVYFFQSLELYSSGKYDDALRLINKAIEIEPKFFNAHMMGIVIALELWSATSDYECSSSLLDVLGRISKLMQLSPCPVQAAHVEASLRTLNGISPEDPLLGLLRFALAKLSKSQSAIKHLGDEAKMLASNVQQKNGCEVRILEEIIELENQQF
ncbi:hypothetical protein [Lentilitoribacter sp. EG35]|uniref:hypothetical protein n=1 Tax=Lentilitoribacter sp. EG35 TaxID=3234192 RepID=UPI00345FD574